MMTLIRALPTAYKLIGAGAIVVALWGAKLAYDSHQQDKGAQKLSDTLRQYDDTRKEELEKDAEEIRSLDDDALSGRLSDN